jgi:AraC-like DNA-binding protein
MLTSPLMERQTVLSSGDVEELTQVGAELFSPHRLQYHGRNARLSATPMGDASLICMQYGGESSVATTEALGYYAVHLPVIGRGAVQFAREQIATGPRRGVVFNPEDQPTMRWSADMCQLAVRIPRSAVLLHVGMLTGRPVGRRLEFTHQSSNAPDWAGALHTMVGIVDTHHAQALPEVLCSRLLDMFLTALVLTQPNNWTPQLFAEAPASAPQTVARAIELIEAAPEAGWTLARLASEAGVSARSLQAGFQRQKGLSPMIYLRDARLRLAHRQLMDPTYDAASITQIATDSGFHHLGRFAAEYQRKYGVKPSHVRRAVRTLS